tara:strand:+ start:11215 stop:11421 length:207 start_codon:yes stop_codon:yes gene_type:complete
MNNELRETDLMDMYNKLQQEQMKLMTDLKNGQEDDKETTRQITELNKLTLGIMRFRNLKKSIEKKKDD